jgi:hypothetical protein
LLVKPATTQTSPQLTTQTLVIVCNDKTQTQTYTNNGAVLPLAVIPERFCRESKFNRKAIEQ